MNREVTIVLAVLLLDPAGSAFAQAEPARESATTQALMVVDHRTTFVPERWCIKSQTPAPMYQLLFASNRRTMTPTLKGDFIAYIFQSADHAALSARLAELDSQRLITFWKGRSLGLFFGVTEGGYVGLSIGQ